MTRRFFLPVRPALIAAALVLGPAGCSIGPAKARYLIEPAPTALRVPSRARTIELREVSLPAYADGDEVVTADADGAVRPEKATLWADAPARAVTGALARSLGEITGATVAADPWPLAGLPDLRVEVRADKMLAGADGVFRIEGQYFVASVGRDLREGAERFAVSAPMAGQDAASAAAAAGVALTALAEQIARTLAR